MLLIFIGTALIGAHGDKSTGTVSWGDIVWGFVFLGVFASCVIDVYKYWRDLP